MRTPASVLADLLRSDPARPRVTFYEDTAGPTQGERIELSAKVLANWVSKAANALQEEFDLGPGSVVRLDLPAPHWRTLYWAMATWSVGAALDFQSDDSRAGDPRTSDPRTSDRGESRTAHLLITDDPRAAARTEAESAIVVTLAALARRHPDLLPGAVMDEARELATYGDQFSAWADPDPSDLALVTTDEATAYETVVPQRDWPQGSRVYVGGDGAGVLTSVLAAWAVDGSVVIVRSPDAGRLSARLEAEGVTLSLG